MSASSPTPQLLAARESIVGEHTSVRRALPHRERRMIGAWCFLDHAGPVQFTGDDGMHVGPHPHIGLQTFTWMIEGELIHRDSLGYEQVIRPGQVNLMTAGRGIAHSEDSVAGGGALHAVQLWIALPDAMRACEPAFAHHPDLPRTDLGGWRTTVLVGSFAGQTSPLSVHTPLLGVDLHAHGAAQTTLALASDFEHGVMLLSGCARVADQVLEPGSLLVLPPGTPTLTVQCEAPAHLVLVGGQPFGEPVLLWWNFVGRTQEEFESALADWNEGRRFGTVRAGSNAAPLQAPSLQGTRLRASPAPTASPGSTPGATT